MQVKQIEICCLLASITTLNKDATVKNLIFIIFGLLFYSASAFSQQTQANSILHELEIEGIRDYSSSGFPRNFLIHEEHLYFTSNGSFSEAGNRVWRLNKQNELHSIDTGPIYGNYTWGHPFQIVNQQLVYFSRDGLKAVSLEDGSHANLLSGEDKINWGSELSFVAFNKHLYFKGRVDMQTGSFCFWKTDGSAEGTTKTDICRVDRAPNFQQLFASNNKLYIVSTNAEDSTKIRVIDAQGTSIELPQDVARRNNSAVKIANEGIFFQTNKALYHSDGTVDGTVVVALDEEVAENDARELLELNDKIFTAVRSEVFVSIADSENVIQLDLSSDDPNESRYSTYPFSFTLVGDLVYFFVRTTEPLNTRSVFKLFVSDGTQEGTRSVFSFQQRSYDSVNIMASEGKRIIFTREHSSDGEHYFKEIWVSDGTEDGTKIISDNSVPIELHNERVWSVFNSRLYYSAPTENQGLELWQSDGTAEGTFISKDIGFSSNHHVSLAKEHFVNNDEYFYFIKTPINFSNDQERQYTQELWRSNLATLATEKLSTINTDEDFSVTLKLASNGIFIWATNTNVGGTSRILSFFDFQSNSLNEVLNQVDSIHCDFDFGSTVGETLYFVSDGASETTRDCQIWSVNGNSNNATQLSNFTDNNANQSGAIAYYILNDVMHFHSVNGHGGDNTSAQLFSTDGTTEGTIEVLDSNDYDIVNAATAGNYLAYNDGIFFTTVEYSPANRRLWFWNAQGVHEVISRPSLHDFTLYKTNGKVLFSIDQELYISDGRAENTVLLDVFDPDYNFSYLTPTYNSNYFFYQTGNANQMFELWQSEGNRADTKLVSVIEGYDVNIPIAVIGDDLYVKASRRIDDKEITYRTNLKSNDISMLYEGEMEPVRYRTMANKFFVLGEAKDIPQFIDFISYIFVSAKSLGDDLDGDGVLDGSDAFPLHTLEQMDSDGDGLGDIADLDDDNDGIPDSSDLAPTDPMVWADYDNDGIGDLADLDDDNDGVTDWNDSYPFDATRFENASGATAPPAIEPPPSPAPDAGGKDGSGGGIINLHFLLLLSVLTFKRRNRFIKSK